ncbi:hypothetical protein K0M31_004439 [Melipona bicolor]|uniref:Uncharacterized protein n=1 Tax=Melipona bicolor TaxID=60889 RepID=A0AA40KNK6_9HYME|nr:hypothetical protein K0M31_004439 [Melipona bicolor]
MTLRLQDALGQITFAGTASCRAASEWNSNKSTLISSGIVGHAGAFNNQSGPSARPALPPLFAKSIDNLRLFGGRAEKFKPPAAASNVSLFR